MTVILALSMISAIVVAIVYRVPTMTSIVLPWLPMMPQLNAHVATIRHQSSGCDSGTLLIGRGTVGPEDHHSNTIGGGCSDGTSGTFHNDESIDKIAVRTLDGSNFAKGKPVEIKARVWAWSTGSQDTADFYYAPDSENPNWTHIASITPPAGGAQDITAQYTLPEGGLLQAVRVNFRYQGSASECSTGSFDDTDDLGICCFDYE